MTSGAPDDLRRQWFRREILPLEPQLLAFARTLARPMGADPEDLVHEVFARAITAENWADIDHPLAFAKRILQNLAVDEFRRRKVAPIDAVADLDGLGIVDQQPGPEAILIARDELRRLQAIVMTLPTQCRRVFTLRKIYGLPPQQIAVQLGISVSTVEKHLTKSLRLCSDRLADGSEAARNTSESKRNWTRNRR